MEEFDKMIWHLDEPQADPAPINVSIISKRAREMGYKVLIGGTAGDDLFSGYRRHIILKKIQSLNWLSLKLISRLISKYLKVNSPKSRRIKKILEIFYYKGDNRIFAFFEWLPIRKVRKLFKKERQSEFYIKSDFDFFKSKLKEIPNERTPLNQMLHIEMNSFLVDHNLNYTDKMGMAHGVEIRVPYLDNDLVEFAENLPPGLKLKKGSAKYLLKKVAEKYLPNEVIYRSKSGFGAPIRNWIKIDFKDHIEIELSKEVLDDQGIFDSNSVNKLISDNQLGKVDASYSIWALLSFQSWYKQFVNK
jgi:asparagine synthase (glutamine-hydrolysing)